MLCDKLGGGLFRIGDSCAVVECQTDGAVWIKELLTPHGRNADLTSDLNVTDLIAPIVQKFPAREYVVRRPAPIGQGRRFGMLAFLDDLHDDFYVNGFVPWYGMAFD